MPEEQVPPPPIVKVHKKSFYAARSVELHQNLADAREAVESVQAQIDANIQLLNQAEPDDDR